MPLVRWPLLKSTHPGFFAVSVSFVLLHAGLALDFLIGGRRRHSAGAWHGLLALAPMYAWGVAHLLCGLALLLGLYVSHRWARAAFAVTALVLWGLAGSFLYGSLTGPTASFSGVVLCSSLALIATRAFVEPRAVVAVAL